MTDPETPASSDPPPHAPRSRKTRLPAIAVALFALAVLCGLFLLFWQPATRDSSRNYGFPPSRSAPIETDWATIRKIFATRPHDIHTVAQTHSRHVTVILKSGDRYVALEPRLDDILNLAQQSPNKKILMATE